MPELCLVVISGDSGVGKLLDVGVFRSGFLSSVGSPMPVTVTTFSGEPTEYRPELSSFLRSRSKRSEVFGLFPGQELVGWHGCRRSYILR